MLDDWDIIRAVVTCVSETLIVIGIAAAIGTVFGLLGLF